MGNNKKISSSTRNAIFVCHLKAFINVRCNSLPNLKIKCGRIKNFIVKSLYGSLPVERRNEFSDTEISVRLG